MKSIRITARVRMVLKVELGCQIANSPLDERDHLGYLSSKRVGKAALDICSAQLATCEAVAVEPLLRGQHLSKYAGLFPLGNGIAGRGMASGNGWI